MLTLSINQLFATPSQLYHKSPKNEINTLLLQVNFVYPSTFYDCRLTFLATQLLSGIIKEKASQKKQIDFLLFQVNFTYQSTFCNSKSKFYDSKLTFSATQLLNAIIAEKASQKEGN